MSRLAAVCAVLVLGCGRYQFDARSDASLDAGPDATAVLDDALDASTCPFTFCTGFENGTAGWDGVDMAGGGTGMVSGEEFVVVLNATSDSTFLRLMLGTPTTSITFGARMTIATANVGTDCELDLVALNWESGTCALPFGFYLVRDGTGPFNLQETNGNAGCNGNRNNYVQTLENTGPHDVKLTILFGNPGSATLYVDGTQVYSRATLQAVPSAPVLLRMGGVIVRNAAAPWTITYDDVFVDVD